MLPLISIIVPIYNKEKDLERCINSLLNQTYRNIEIILINDGSKDSSGKICDTYSKKNQNIISIHKKNGGVSSGRNAGIEAARGTLISFVDPDDYVSPKMIEVLYTSMVKLECDIMCCCSIVETNTGSYKNSFFNELDDNEIILDKHKAIVQLIYNKYYEPQAKAIDIGVPWGKLYKKSLIDSNSLVFNEDLRRMQDNIFNLYAFQYAHKIGYIDSPLYFYNNKNISQVINEYSNDIDSIVHKVIEETYIFLNEFEWIKDKDIQVAFEAKKVSMLLLGLSKKYLNPRYNITLRNRQILVKKFLQLHYFKSIYSGKHLIFYAKHNRVLLKMLKSEKIITTYFIFLIRNILKNYSKK